MSTAALKLNLSRKSHFELEILYLIIISHSFTPGTAACELCLVKKLIL